jgi:hypothetical protein
MADAPIQIDVQVLTQKATTALTGFVGAVQGGAKKIEGAFASASTSFGLFSNLFVGGSIIKAIGTLDEMVSRVNTSITEAANSMRNLGGALNVAEIKDFVNNLGQGAAAGVASLTELYDGVQQLGLHVRDTAELERAMTDAVQLAAAKHISFSDAISLVGRVLSGHITMLTRAGVVTADEAKNIHTVEQAMELLEQKTKGATDALDAHTVGWGKVGNAWQQTALDFGTALGPALTDLINLLDWLAQEIDKLGQAWNVGWTFLLIIVQNTVSAIRDILKNELAPAALSIGELVAGALTGNINMVKDGIAGLKAVWADAKNTFDFYAAATKNSLEFAALNAGFGPPSKTGAGSAQADGSATFEGDVTGGARKGRTKKAPIPEFASATFEITAAALADPTVAIAKAYAEGAGINKQLEAIRVQRGVGAAQGTLTPEKDAALKAQEAQLQEQLAKLNLIVAESREQIAKYDFQTAQATGNKQNELDAERKVELAHRAVYTAENALTVATGNVVIAQAAVANEWRKLYPTIARFHDTLALLSDKANDLGTFWEQVAQRSIAVREAMTILGNIFTLVARLLDAVLVPIIRVVNFVLTDLANIVIDVWNVFAALLNALGIHVDYLKHINSLLGDLGLNVRPLIDIIHDLPTLKEYGAGKWGPLQPDQYGSGSLLGGLISSQQQQSTFLQKIIGVLGLIFALDWLTHSKFYADMSTWFTALIAKGQTWWKDLSAKSQDAIAGAAHITAGVALVENHTGGALGFLEKIFGVMQIVQGILLIIQALTAAKAVPFLGGFLCPAVDQMMETKERGFIRAGDLEPGMHLRAPNNAGWNRINAVKIFPTTIVRSNNAEESVDVNWNHAFRDKNGAWVLARALEAGDELLRDCGGTVKIISTDVIGPGYYAAIDCDNHEYVIGTTIGHNDSNQAALALANAATRAFSVTVGTLGEHASSIANAPGGVASAASRVIGGSGSSGGGGIGVLDQSTQVSQDVHIGQVNEAANLEEVMAALSVESVFLGKGRAYQQGYQGI